MDLDIKALKTKLDNYLASTSTKQLKKDLIKAGLKVYVSSEHRFLDDYEKTVNSYNKLITIESTKEAHHFLMENEADAVYSKCYVQHSINLTPEIRPTYPLRGVNVGSSNQESNWVNIGFLNRHLRDRDSAAENTIA